MGTEILRPQDCLLQSIRLSPSTFHHRRSYEKPRIQTHRKPMIKPEKFPENTKMTTISPEPLISKRSPSADDFKTGKVTILRRGQSLGSLKSKREKTRTFSKMNGDDYMVCCGTGRIGPDPEMVPKPGSGDMYAGSAFFMSPSPTALPLPSFFNKKPGMDSGSIDDLATRDIRRLLRLE